MAKPRKALAALDNFHRLTGPQGPTARVAGYQSRSWERQFRVPAAARTQCELLTRTSREGVAGFARQAQPSTLLDGGGAFHALRTRQPNKADVPWPSQMGPAVRTGLTERPLTAFQRKQERLLADTLRRGQAQLRMIGPSSLVSGLRLEDRHALQRLRGDLWAAQRTSPWWSDSNGQVGALLRRTERLLASDRQVRQMTRQLDRSLAFDRVGAAGRIGLQTSYRQAAAGLLARPWPTGYPGAALWENNQPLNLTQQTQLRDLLTSQQQLQQAVRDASRLGLWHPGLAEPLPPQAPAPGADSQEQRTAALVAAIIMLAHTAQDAADRTQRRGRLVVAQVGDLLEELGQGVERGTAAAVQLVEQTGWALHLRNELMASKDLTAEERQAIEDKETFLAIGAANLAVSVELTFTLAPTNIYRVPLDWTGLLALRYFYYRQLGRLAAKYGRAHLVPGRYQPE